MLSQRLGEENISPEGSLDLVFFDKPVRGVGASNHLAHLRLLHGRKHGCAAEVYEWLCAQPDILLREETCGRLIHQMTMLNHLDACSNRASDGVWRIGVGRNIGSPIGSCFDGRPQFSLTEGGHIQWAERRSDAAACRQLDLRCALHELFARSLANRVGAVGDHASTELLDAARSAETLRQLPELTEVAMPPRDCDDGTRRIDARAYHDPLIDGALQREGRAAHVPDGGEPAHQ